MKKVWPGPFTINAGDALKLLKGIKVIFLLVIIASEAGAHEKNCIDRKRWVGYMHGNLSRPYHI
jgi:hypothetical protein